MFKFKHHSQIEDEIKKLKVENRVEVKRYGIILNCGGSIAAIADSWLTNNNAEEEVRISQELDVSNIQQDDIAGIEYPRELVLKNYKPMEAIIINFWKKKVESYKNWIIGKEKNER